MIKMKNIVILILLFGILINLSGCYSASPQFLRGNYYMTGDSNCRFSRERTDTSINCYTSDDEKTGYRNAMTDQQLQMHQHNEQMAQQKSLAREHRNKTVNCYTYGNITTCN